MRLVVLSVAFIALGAPAFAEGAPETAGVTVLRGSSAPPPPAAPAPTTIIQRETVYQPVYLDPPGYLWVVPPATVARRAPGGPVPAQTAVPNGWPLLSTGRR